MGEGGGGGRFARSGLDNVNWLEILSHENDVNIIFNYFHIVSLPLLT